MTTTLELPEPIVEVKKETMFDRMNGECMGCHKPVDELTERTINGVLTYTCPVCRTIHTENCVKFFIPDPDKTRLNQMVKWIV